MDLARGEIGDRPWGDVFAGFALDESSCELVIDDRYRVAFTRNAVIAASSPLVGDSALRVAVTLGMVDQASVSPIIKRLATEAGRDSFEVIAETAGLTADTVWQLRRRVTAQAAMRTFAIASGRYRVTREVTLVSDPDSAIDVRAIVYGGLRSYLDDERLVSDLDCLGSGFLLRAPIADAMAQYGVSADARPMLESLATGGTIVELVGRHPELAARDLRALVYALVACRDCDATRVRVTARSLAVPVVRQTGTLPPAMPSTPTRVTRTLANGSSPGLSRPRDIAVAKLPTMPPAPVAPSVTFRREPAATPPAPNFTLARAARTTMRGPAVAPPAADDAPFDLELTPGGVPAEPTISPSERYERGLVLLRSDIARAITELEAAALASKHPDHIAALAWAKFCAAPDKASVEKETRHALAHAIFKSESPELARFYLGRVERMLGRDREALEQFKIVASLKPRHAEALAEIRMLDARLSSAPPRKR